MKTSPQSRLTRHALLTRMLGTARTLHTMQAHNLAEFEQAMARCMVAKA